MKKDNNLMTIPKYLYHYTSQTGLLGILNTGTLWMTNILYLNDSSEFKHTLDLVKSELSEQKKQIPPCPSLERCRSEYSPEEIITVDIHDTFNIIGDVVDNIYRLDVKEESYVFSLSERKNDLSQWRGYCPREGGFCIEFDYDSLLSVIKNTKRCTLKKCIYDPKEKNDLVKFILDFVITSFKSNIKMDSYKASSEVLNKINEYSSCIKHESFIFEDEHRIIIKNHSYEMKYCEMDYLKHCEGKSMIIPYIIYRPVDKDDKLPISKIIVGPTPHPELSKSSVDRLLKSNRYDIEVEISKIPYRSW